MSCLLLLALDNLGNLRHVVVEVAGAEYHEHVEVAVLYKVEHVFLVNHALLHTLLEVVVYQLRCYAWYRLLACRVDVAQNNLVEL